MATGAVDIGESVATSALRTEGKDECFLARRLDCLLAVVLTHPGDCLRRRSSGEHGETRQGRACSPMTAPTAEFHAFVAPRPIKHVLERNPECIGVRR